MAERPILFSAAMVRAILDGRKTQTRRVVKDMPSMPEADCHPRHKQLHPAPYFDAYCGARRTEQNPRGMSGSWCWWQVDDRQCLPTIRCPYGVPGDTLWVRETFALPRRIGNGGREENLVPDHDVGGVCFLADGPAPTGYRSRPSIHMPRWASRLTLLVKSVRVERVQDIAHEDAIAEGCRGTNWVASSPYFASPHTDDGELPQEEFQALWEATYPGSWERNDWIWVVEFERVKEGGK